MLPYPSTGDALLLVNLPPASPWQQLPVGAHLMPSLDSTGKLSPSAVEMILTPCLQWALRNRVCVSLLVGGRCPSLLPRLESVGVLACKDSYSNREA